MSRLAILASERFGDLTVAEQRVLSAAPLGEEAFCGPSSDYWSNDNDPQHASDWGQERAVRASILFWLYSPEVIHSIHTTGITVIGANIQGKLNLFYTSLSRNFELGRCLVAGGIDLSFAETATVLVRACDLSYVRAPWLIAKGDVSLDDCVCHGLIDFYAAEISGTLSIRRGRIYNSDPDRNEAVDLTLAHVGKHLFLNEATTTTLIKAPDAQIGGGASLDRVTFCGDKQ